MDIAEKLGSIEEKVAQVAAKMAALERDKAALSTQNEHLETTLRLQEAKIKVLEEQLSAAPKATAHLAEEASAHSKQMRQQIDQYIEHIERCIEWLKHN